MAGLTPAHLFLVLIVALVVIGPGKLPEVGAAVGKSVREFQKASSGVQESVAGVLTHSAPDVPVQQAQAPMAPVQTSTMPTYFDQSGYAAPVYPAAGYPAPVSPAPQQSHACATTDVAPKNAQPNAAVEERAQLPRSTEKGRMNVDPDRVKALPI